VTTDFRSLQAGRHDDFPTLDEEALELIRHEAIVPGID